MTRWSLLCSFILVGISFSIPLWAQPNVVRVHRDDQGTKIQVDGEDIMLFGMNWTYVPVGENYAYSFWSQPDDFIRDVLHREMRMLREMGVNVIRQEITIPPRWITWIYEHYGIYTVVNHKMGRYGISINGGPAVQTDYGNPVHRRMILDELRNAVETYHGTRGVLMWMLGNENNYGLHWTSFDAEDLPDEDATGSARAVQLYSLMGEGIALIKSRDSNHPVSLANGDLQYIELIARYCPGLDVMGSNVYRGPSARDFFDEIHRHLGIPAMFTEFGADAYNARTEREDHVAQAAYLLAQWQEIYEQSYGHGRANNAIGGFIFQWTDGWWKSDQEEYLDVHDTSASWSNDAYPHDFVQGRNNMNEEWFGIVAQLPQRRSSEPRRVRARAAYYVLRDAFRLPPYAEETTLARIHEHFSNIRPDDYASRYDASLALDQIELFNAVRVSNLRLVLDSSISRGSAATERGDDFAFDHTESVFVDFVLQPNSRLYGRVSLNVLGNVATNRLDSISYASRGQSWTPEAAEEGGDDLQRVDIYQAEFTIDHFWFELEGYYRTGHHHWGDQGDFFGLYRSASYGPNLDTYNGRAPFGMVFQGRRAVDGLRVAIGPELFWGANPMMIAQYRRGFGPFSFSLMHQEDFAEASAAGQTSSAIPEPRARRTAISLGFNFNQVKLEFGGLFSGSRRVGDGFVWTRTTSGRGYLDSGLEVLEDEIQWLDTLAAKIRMTVNAGRVRLNLQGAYRGLVADSGPDEATMPVNWSLRESGRGNQFNLLAGAVINAGHFQIGPNILYQRPLVGPIPRLDDYYSTETGIYYPGLKPRNIFDSPFAVLENRETLGFELMLAFDPTPNTWFFRWNRYLREDAAFAASLDFTYRVQPTSRDASIVFLEDRSMTPLNNAPPAQNVWDATLEFVSNPWRYIRLSGSLFVGQGQSTGEDARLVTRYGGDVRLSIESFLLMTKLLFNDWGPYDYHRDFNQTYPIQWYADISYGLDPAVLGRVDTRFGFRAQLRSLNTYSEGYSGDGDQHGLEYELGVYVTLGL